MFIAKIKAYFSCTVFHDKWYHSRLGEEIAPLKIIKIAYAIFIIVITILFAHVYRFLIFTFSIFILGANKHYFCFDQEWIWDIGLASITSIFFIIDWRQNSKDKKNKESAEKTLPELQQLSSDGEY